MGLNIEAETKCIPTDVACVIVCRTPGHSSLTSASTTVRGSLQALGANLVAFCSAYVVKAPVLYVRGDVPPGSVYYTVRGWGPAC